LGRARLSAVLVVLHVAFVVAVLVGHVALPWLELP
jgi:hypothetical protein